MGEETKKDIAPVEKKSMLVGKTTETQLKLPPFSVWYQPNYEGYMVRDKEMETLKPLLNGLKIKVFMGTWCVDSQREVPHFYKIIDALGHSQENIDLIAMNRQKSTPENYEEGLNITNVPTFIFYRNGKEINRIVEYPMESLEVDMKQILTGTGYRHAYAD